MYLDFECMEFVIADLYKVEFCSDQETLHIVILLVLTRVKVRKSANKGQVHVSPHDLLLLSRPWSPGRASGDSLQRISFKGERVERRWNVMYSFWDCC